MPSCAPQLEFGDVVSKVEPCEHSMAIEAASQGGEKLSHEYQGRNTAEQSNGGGGGVMHSLRRVRRLLCLHHGSWDVIT